jgi:hypothetical protein
MTDRRANAKRIERHLEEIQQRLNAIVLNDTPFQLDQEERNRLAAVQEELIQIEASYTERLAEGAKGRLLDPEAGSLVAGEDEEQILASQDRIRRKLIEDMQPTKAEAEAEGLFDHLPATRRKTDPLH